jgi:hypothetical protein
MRSRLVPGLAVIVFALLMQTSVAEAASGITVSPSSAHQGDTVTVSGNVPVSGTASCASGDAVQLTSTADLFPPDGFGPQATRDASGNFQVQYVIPAATPPGTYNIGVRCGGGNVGITTTLHVTSASGTLARTGSGVLVRLGLVGAASMALGLLLLRRRGAATPPPQR